MVVKILLYVLILAIFIGGIVLVSSAYARYIKYKKIKIAIDNDYPIQCTRDSSHGSVITANYPEENIISVDKNKIQFFSSGDFTLDQCHILKKGYQWQI